jgi:transposase
VTVSPVTRRIGFYFATDPDGYFTAAKVVGFLRDLLRHLHGKVTVVWDGGNKHKGPLMREFVKRKRRLRLERRPAYSLHLNPAEAVWSWLKYGKLANFVPDDVAEVKRWVGEFHSELKFDPGLRRWLWEGSERPFPLARIDKSE